MFKVVHIITRFDKGGSAENTFLSSRGLAQLGYDISLVTGLATESQMGIEEQKSVACNFSELTHAGVKIVEIPALVRALKPVSDLRAFVSMVALFRKTRPHIVHTHTSKAGILGRWAAFLCRVPIIIHTPHGHVFWGYFGKLKTGVFIVVERITARITDSLVMLTDREKNDHIAYHIAPPDKYDVIHSGIDVKRFQDGPKKSSHRKKLLKIKKNIPVVGTVGRCTAIKGQEYFVKAAAKVREHFPTCTFVILGDGDDRPFLQAMANERGLADHIIFLGWRNDVAEIMSAFDVFVLPSLNEGMGRVLVEAMVMEKPVVASDVGGIPDLVVNGVNGYRVPPGNAPLLAEKIIELLADEPKRLQMGKCGKTLASRYSAASMVEKIDQLYQRHLQQRNWHRDI